ncbi:hypothetical protein O6H91_18G066700 [Diphasiastrum complanatum]|uniref:Uncharacterized protein n=1 Tax=Diphasiastrum complanatum TaxID=34168 RepID=A0ACC2B2F4_DIPCM|nr:hypothetical protein O6H91_18G066700 [Diphasiastrum complanatum]
MKNHLDLYATGAQALCDLGVKEIPKTYVQPHHQRPNSLNIVRGKQLPLIDLSRLCGDGRNQVMEELRFACESWGFFHVINHGFPQNSMNAMMEVGRQFFELPLDVKMRFFHPKPTNVTHYGGSFSSKDECVSNWRDYLVHPCLPLSDEIVDTWPDLPPRYREIAKEYSKNVRVLALKLLALLSESLGLRESYLDETFKGHVQLMNINHYPPCPQPDLTLGVNGHTDPNGITILQQDDVAGLEVLKDGSWYAVNPVPNSFVINMGDQMQIISNGRYKSIEHRGVVNSEKTRFSIAAFCGPSYHAIIAPAAELIKQRPDQSAEYDEVVYGEYVRQIYSKGVNGKYYIDSVKIQKK